MNLADVMDALAARLAAELDMSISAVPGGPITPPMAQVQYPAAYSYDGTYGRGADTLEIPIIVVASMADPLSVRERLSAMTAGSGPWSVKEVLEGPGPLLDGTVTVHVASVQFTTESLAGQQYAAAEFTVQLTGPGLEP